MSSSKETEENAGIPIGLALASTALALSLQDNKERVVTSECRTNGCEWPDKVCPLDISGKQASFEDRLTFHKRIDMIMGIDEFPTYNDARLWLHTTKDLFDKNLGKSANALLEVWRDNANKHDSDTDTCICPRCISSESDDSSDEDTSKTEKGEAKDTSTGEKEDTKETNK